MAFVQTSGNEDEQKKNQNGQVDPSGSGAAVQLAPSSGIGEGGGANTGSPPGRLATRRNPAGGGSFATLDKYINANQGQAAPLAGKITSGINDQYNTLNQGNSSTIQGLNQSVGSAYTPKNQSLLDQEAANPVGFADDANNVSAFQKQLNNQYTGPTSAESAAEYQKQQSQINNAIAQGNASTQTEAGRKGLLNSVEKSPTAGVTALNSAILSKDPNAQGSIENAYKPFNNLLSGLSTGAQGVNQNIAKAQTDSQAARDAANKQIADQTAAFQSGVQGRYTDALNGANAYNSSLSQFTQNTAPIESALHGFEGAVGQNIDDPLQQYLSMKQVNAPSSIESTARPEDFAFQNALSMLGGQPVSLLNPALSAQGGSYQAPGALNIPNLDGLVGQLALNAKGTQHGVSKIDENSSKTPFNQLLKALSGYTSQIKPFKSPYPDLYNVFPA